ncbi:cytochrome P450 76T24-like [Prosopis cineraria]|uniref:cytochrome P450 76T24-like n=1 Tax=Prosopis cineraria TaxID=364024 RepID=UPI00240EA4EE|nr:cytochrome P450 76T24-like [Prosopis cineraria]
MDSSTPFLVLTFLLSCLWILIFFHQKQNPKSSKLPPGPPPFPIIGNILEIGKNPHQSLSKLSKTYGSLMTVKLGSITTIVISSPTMAKEALHKHDSTFSGRTVLHTLQTFDHHKLSVVFLDPSVHWKTLKRVCVTKIFSSSQLDSTQNLRLRKLQEMLEYANECCRKGEGLDIGELAFTTVLNSISSTLFSIDLAGYASGSSREFRDHVWGIMEEAGKPNIADFFPVLRVLDPQGARSRMDNYAGKLFKMLDDIVGERMELVRASKMESFTDVLGSLLSHKEEDKPQVGRLDIVHLFGDLLVAGADTTSSTVEWAMAELLSNPQKLEKLKKELQQAIGEEDIKMEESNVSKLPFLRAVIKETLRLHPPAPLLVPHKALEDADICGFTVPKNAQILINIWAMGRDSTIWCNPNQFMPERFLESEIDFKGHDFELIPFGAGRRICPGLPLAFRLVHLMLASLILKYNWKLADDLHPHEIDMEEKFGLTLKRVQPLRAIPTEVIS